MTVLTLLINAPLTAPLLSWVVARDQSVDDNQKLEFEAGVKQFNVRTRELIDGRKTTPYVGLSPDWTAVSELLLKVPATLTAEFPKGTEDRSAENPDADGAPWEMRYRENSNALRHARLAFLRAVAADVKEQAEHGWLRWHSATYLEHLVSVLEDQVSCECPEITRKPGWPPHACKHLPMSRQGGHTRYFVIFVIFSHASRSSTPSSSFPMRRGRLGLKVCVCGGGGWRRRRRRF